MKKLSYQLPFYISILLFLCSLGLQFYTSGQHHIPGIFFFLGGWLYFLNDIPSFIAWFANITYFLGIFSVSRKKPKPVRGMIYSVLSLVLGSAGMAAGSVVSETSSRVMQNASVGNGFYVWIISFVLLLVSMLLRLKNAKK